MSVLVKYLPKRIYLNDYHGNFHRYIDAVYEIFKRDFIDSKPHVGDLVFKLKSQPLYQDRAYTFYHMTHKGHDETKRVPDLRRCERLPWCKPGIENTEKYSLKFWEQDRKGKTRICIWIEAEDEKSGRQLEDNYFIVLDIRKDYILPWTAFCAEYQHQVEKKLKEYNEWEKSIRGKNYTLYSLIKEVMNRK